MSSRSLLLALDIGSSSVRSAFFAPNGARVLPSTAQRKYSITYSPNGGAELDPAVLLRAARGCVEETLRWQRNSTTLRKTPIIAVAGSAFWHSLVALGRKQQPISPIYMWADSRSADDARALREELSERTIHARTGCMVRAAFWPAKLRWLRRTRPSLFRRTLSWVSPCDWIFHELFGSQGTSHSMASGTGFYNLKTATWDAELCHLCEVQPTQLGLLVAQTERDSGAHFYLPGVPVFPAIGDGVASNLGSGADHAGTVAITIGTSGAVRRIVRTHDAPARAPFGLFKYVLDENRVVLGGAISNGGNLREWFGRELRLPPRANEMALSRRAAAHDELTILPFWVSERAPTWPENLRGAITGFHSTTRAHDLLRAATTATYYRLAQILDLLRPAATAEIIVSGGVLHSRAALALLADCLGRDIRISNELESSLRGGALLALKKLGFIPSALRPGRLIRHQPALAELHRARRAQQAKLEHVLGRSR